MRKILFVLLVLLVLAVCGAAFSEAEDDITIMIEGQSFELPSIDSPVALWDQEYLQLEDEKAFWGSNDYNASRTYRYVFKAIKPGNVDLYCSHPYWDPFAVTILPQTEIPDWLPGAWETKITAGAYKGQTCRLFFHDDGTVYELVIRSKNQQTIFYGTYSCAEGFLRIDYVSDNMPVLGNTYKLENNTIVRVKNGWEEVRDWQLKCTAFKPVKINKDKGLTDIMLKVSQGRMGEGRYEKSSGVQEEITLPEGSPGRAMIVRYNRDPDYRGDESRRVCFHSTDPAVAYLDGLDPWVKLYALKPGTVEVWATLSDDENVVSNKITVHVLQADAGIPDAFMDYTWQMGTRDGGLADEYCTFYPGGEAKRIRYGEFGAIVTDERYAVSGDLLAINNYENMCVLPIENVDGQLAVSAWKQTELPRGFVKYGNTTVYYDENNLPATGWFEVDGKTYLADHWGRILVHPGDYIVEGVPYTFDEEGAVIPHQYTNEAILREFVECVYANLYYEQMDEESKSDCVRQILDGVKTPMEAACEILLSENARNEVTDEAFVRALYTIFTWEGAESESADVEGWTRKLNRGLRREDAVAGFIQFGNVFDLWNHFD